MSQNQLITTGKILRPLRVVLYGPEGIGKSTFASQFPNPVFMDIEGGTYQLNIARFPVPKSAQEMWKFIDEGLIHAKHEYKTLVIDTADWFETLISKYVCSVARKDSIEDFGYGKGYVVLKESFQDYLNQLQRLIDEKGMNVVFTAHSQIKRFEDPDQSGGYDRYELKCSRHVCSLLKEWCDLLFFVNYKTTIIENDGKRKAVGGRDRIIHTEHSAAGS